MSVGFNLNWTTWFGENKRAHYLWERERNANIWLRFIIEFANRNWSCNYSTNKQTQHTPQLPNNNWAHKATLTTRISFTQHLMSWPRPQLAAVCWPIKGRTVWILNEEKKVANTNRALVYHSLHFNRITCPTMLLTHLTWASPSLPVCLFIVITQTSWW